MLLKFLILLRQEISDLQCEELFRVYRERLYTFLENLMENYEVEFNKEDLKKKWEPRGITLLHIMTCPCNHLLVTIGLVVKPLKGY